MQEVSGQKDVLLHRISGIVNHLMQEDSVYHNLDKNEIMPIFSQLLDKVSPTQLNMLDDAKLAQRVRKIMATQLMYHLLDDFSPEQKEVFFAAVEGR